jgi:hypothetical protein
MAAHVLNLAPTKSARNTPYEMSTKNKPSLNYLRVWGNGYQFYCLGHTKRLWKLDKRNFFEDNDVNELRKIDLE